MHQSSIAALYVDKRGPYMGMEGVDPWTIDRDAKLYDGPSPVVAHPPCADWGSLRPFARDDPARKLCGPRAVEQVRAFGGVLEHPANTTLWAELRLPKPRSLGTLGRSSTDEFGGWTLAVEQCAWGHVAQKGTWLYIVGVRSRNVEPRTGGDPTHVVSSLSRRRRTQAARPQLPEMKKSLRHITPPAFAEFLVTIARGAHHRGRQRVD